MINLNDKLSIEDQRAILSHIDYYVDEHGFDFDEAGDEFHGSAKNDKWELRTLAGILDYVKHLGEENGKWILRNDIRNSLGL